VGLLDTLPPDVRALARPAPQPRDTEPMKARLHDKPFSDPAWVFERKARWGSRARVPRRREGAAAQPHRPGPRAARWAKPELVAQIGFTEWTRGGRLRHPRYLGLRDDKPASEVIRERPG
jgi:ATP dependent DNA ligase C terminal region